MTAPLTLQTRSGLQIDIRPAEEADKPLIADLFDRISDEDRRFRFFSAAKHISQEQLEPLIHADHYRSESVLAFDRATGELVASGLLACDKAMDTAEVAVSVRTDYKGKGVGWTLLDHLGREAEARGVRRVISIESRDNHSVIELEREKGFAVEAVEDDPSIVILAKTFR